MRVASLTRWPLKLHGNQWAQVARHIPVRIKVPRKSAARTVLHRSNVLLVRLAFALARHPHLFALRGGQTDDVLSQFGGHLVGQAQDVVVVLGHPVEDLCVYIKHAAAQSLDIYTFTHAQQQKIKSTYSVELDKDARFRLAVAESVGQSARTKVGRVHGAHLSGWRGRLEVAVHLIGIAAGGVFAVIDVRCKCSPKYLTASHSYAKYYMYLRVRKCCSNLTLRATWALSFAVYIISEPSAMLFGSGRKPSPGFDPANTTRVYVIELMLSRVYKYNLCRGLYIYQCATRPVATEARCR